MSSDTIEIKVIDHSFARNLTNELANENKEYLRYFTPFEVSFPAIEKMLRESKKDKYFGIFVNNNLAGFYMLRGLDAGYDIPAYGVWISSKYSNCGLSTLTLYHAFAFCKMNSIKKLMLKVYPQNKTAKELFESVGFIQTGIDTDNTKLIYHKSFRS